MALFQHRERVKVNGPHFMQGQAGTIFASHVRECRGVVHLVRFDSGVTVSVNEKYLSHLVEVEA